MLRCTIDFCVAARYKCSGLEEETAAAPSDRSRDEEGGQTQETAMMMFNFVRFLRERRIYWSVVQELSTYTDRELHDIGIDRADIHEIARLAAKEAKA